MADQRKSSDVKGPRTRLQKRMKSCSAEEFLQYFVGSVILVSGLTLLAISIWSFSIKTFFHAHVMTIKIDPTFFTSPSSVLCVPCFFLTTCLGSNRRQVFYTLIGLTIVALITVVAGYSLGTKYQPKFSNVTLRLGSTIPTTYLNYTLSHLLTYYENNTECKTSMDRIQRRLKCCGVQSNEDYSTIPASCCKDNDCQNNKPYLAGCLRPMQANIAWHKNICLSLCQIGILMYIFHIVMIVPIYASYYFKRKEEEIFNMEARRKLKI